MAGYYWDTNDNVWESELQGYWDQELPFVFIGEFLAGAEEQSLLMADLSTSLELAKSAEFVLSASEEVGEVL